MKLHPQEIHAENIQFHDMLDFTLPPKPNRRRVIGAVVIYQFSHETATMDTLANHFVRRPFLGESSNYYLFQILFTL